MRPIDSGVGIRNGTSFVRLWPVMYEVNVITSDVYTEVSHADMLVLTHSTQVLRPLENQDGTPPASPLDNATPHGASSSWSAQGSRLAMFNFGRSHQPAECL
jgi:hypothetical protein